MGVLSGYDRATVEAVLPAVWDDKYLETGFRNDTAPDPEMPKGSVDHSKSGTHIVVIADVRVAWKRAELDNGIRQSMLLRYGFDEPSAAGARLLGIDRRTLERRCEKGVGIIVAYLNGEADINSEEEAA